MKKSLLTAAVLMTATVSYAENALDDVVTIANRVAAPSINSAQIVVVDRDDIETSGANNLYSLLASKAGFQFSKTGGVPHSSNLYINGLDGKQVLFLVNGQRVGSATSGTTEVQLIALEQIERIEIIKGSRSAIYGADAQAGVVNIITRLDTTLNEVAATVGTNQTKAASLRTRHQFGDVDTYLNVNHDRSAGYDINNDTENDRDGYERNGLNAGVGYAISEQQSVNFDAQVNRGSYDYDNSFGGTDEADFDNRALNLGYTLNTDGLQLNARAGRGYDRSWNYGNGVTRSGDAQLFGSRKDVAEITALIDLTEHVSLLAAADTRLVKLLTRPVEYDTDNERNHGGLLGVRYSSDSIAAEIGARIDENSNYGRFRSFNTSVAFYLTDNQELAFGQATAFRAPTFNDLYYPASDFGDYSNEDLKAETSRIWSVDYTAAYDNFAAGGSVTVSGQRSLFNNQIVSNSAFYPVNLGESYVNFASVTWAQNWDDAWNSELIQEWTEARNQDTGNLIERRPIRATKLNVRWTSGKLSSALESQYRGQAPSRSGDYIAPFVLLNLSATWEASQDFSLTARIENLTDREYETVPGYEAQGRYAQVTGRYSF